MADYRASYSTAKSLKGSVSIPYSLEALPIASEDKPGIVSVGDNLKIDENGRLSVDTTDKVEKDNTKPITSAAVDATVGNIAVLLQTI